MSITNTEPIDTAYRDRLVLASLLEEDEGVFVCGIERAVTEGLTKIHATSWPEKAQQGWKGFEKLGLSKVSLSQEDGRAVLLPDDSGVLTLSLEGDFEPELGPFVIGGKALVLHWLIYLRLLVGDQTFFLGSYRDFNTVPKLIVLESCQSIADDLRQGLLAELRRLPETEDAHGHHE